MLIKVADVPAELVLRCPGAESFFRAFETELAPRFSVDPTEADLERTRAAFTALALARGRVRSSWPSRLLESYTIHRLLAEKLVWQNVLLMHGSALCMDGEAIIFSAPSGTGKSTHARLWRETFGDRVWMINDDKPLLRIEDGRATVYGSPWNGKHRLGRNASAPLKAIVFLNRGEENRIEPLEKAEAFPLLMRQCFHSRDPAAAGRILEMETALLSEASFFRLWCNQTAEAARVAYEGIRSDASADRA